MTKNKKKLRRAERRYSVTKSAQTLVLAGMLLAGGVTGAMAAQTELTAGPLTENTTYSDADGYKATGTTQLQIGTHTATFTTAGGLTINKTGGHDGILGYGDSGYTGKVVFDTGFGTGTISNGSAIGAAVIEIKAGTLNLSGARTAGASEHAWRAGSILMGDQGVNVSGGTINLGDKALLTAGFAGSDTTNTYTGINVTGGKIVLAGTSSSNSSVLVASSATGNAVPAATSYTTLKIAGGTVEVSANNYGIIASRDTTISSGALNVAGTLLMVGAMGNSATNTDTGFAGAGQATKSKLLLNGTGAITVAAGGVVYAPQMHFTQDGGKVTVKGKFYTDKNDASWAYTDSSYTLQNGSLIIEGNGNANGDGTLQAGNLAIKGGTVLVSGVKSANWAHSPTLGGYGIGNSRETNITGGVVTLGNNGVLFAGVEDTTGNGELNINNGAQVILAGASGQGGIIYAASADAYSGSHSDANYAVVLNISGANTAVTVNGGKEGYILSRETNLTGGAQLNVNGTLTVAGKAAKGGTVADGITGDGITKGAIKVDGVDSRITVADGGTLKLADKMSITMSNNGELNLKDHTALTSIATAKTTVTVDGAQSRIRFRENATIDVSKLAARGAEGSIALTNSGILQSEKRLTLTGATLNTAGNVKSYYMNIGADGTGTMTVAGGQLKVIGKKSATDTNQDVLNATELKTSGAGNIVLGDSSEGTIGGTTTAKITTVGTGSFTVEAGTWKVGNVNIGSGTSLTIQSGTLDVSGSTLTVNSGATAVTVNTTGNLVAKAGDFTTDGATLNGTAQKQLTNGGRLTLTGADATLLAKFDTLGKLATFTAALQTGAGTVTIEGLKADSLITPDTSLADASAANTAFTESTVKSGTSGTDTLGGNIVVKQIDASNVSGDTYTITTGGKGLALVGGGEGTELVSGGKTTTVSGDLTLGDVGGKTGGGTLTGSVAKNADGSGGTATAVNGGFTVTGDVANGAIAAENASLTVGGDVTAGGAKAIAAGSKTTVQGDVLAGGAQATAAGSETTVQGNVAGGVEATGAGSKTTVLGNATGGAEADNGSTIVVKDTFTQTAAVTVANSSTMTVGTFASNSSHAITVGDPTAEAGSLSIATLDTRAGGKFFVDPVNGNAELKIGALTGGKMGALMVAGNNAIVTFGDHEKAWVLDQTSKGMPNADSVLVVSTPMKVTTATGQLLVGEKFDASGEWNGTGGASTHGVALKGNSLFIADMSNVAAGDALITLGDNSGNTTVSIDKSAGIRLHDASGVKGNSTYSLIGDLTALDQEGTAIADKGKLTLASMSTSTRLVALESVSYDASGKFLNANTRSISAASVLPNLNGELAHMLDKMALDGVRVNSSQAGIKFLSRAVSPDYMPNATEAAATIEGAAQLAVVGATQGVTMSAVTAGSSAAISRTSMASPLMSQKAQAVALNGENLDSGLSAGDVKNGVGLWVMPLYQSTNTWGMKSGEFKTGSTSDLGGVAIGADYTFNDAFRVGVAFNVGGGYAESTGDFNKTDNNFNFWGVNLYGGWAQNNFGITADVGYTSTYSKLEQELQASMDMGAIKADVTSSAITAGLRGEYKFETSALDIIPHVGVRYMSLMTDSYDAKSNGTVFKADESYQSIWTFPIGVTFAKEIESASGWTFRPQLDLQVIPAAGDVKAKSKVRVPGIDSSAELSTRVMDDITYGGGVGFDVKKGDISFGLNYNIQASEHSTSHGVFGTVRYEF